MASLKTLLYLTIHCFSIRFWGISSIRTACCSHLCVYMVIVDGCLLISCYNKLLYIRMCVCVQNSQSRLIFLPLDRLLRQVHLSSVYVWGTEIYLKHFPYCCISLYICVCIYEKHVYYIYIFIYIIETDFFWLCMSNNLLFCNKVLFYTLGFWKISVLPPTCQFST